VPNVPEHLFLARTSKGLAVRRQSSEQVHDSAIVIRVLAAGVCGTDLAMLSGGRICRAEVLGHEGVGVVIYAPEHSGIPKGCRVIINPVHQKQPELVIGHSRDGIFREMFWLDVSEALQGRHLVACVAQCPLTDSELAVAEPVASVLYSFELLQEKENPTTLLIRGSGTVGVLAARLWAKLVAGSTVVLVSKSEFHAQWLRNTCQWPANVNIRSLEVGNVAEAAAAGFDAAILCCSRQDAAQGLHFLLDWVKTGATIDLMAGFPAEHKEPRLGGLDLDRIRWNNICGTQSGPATTMRDWKTEKTVRVTGHRGTSERHILQAVELLSHGTISLAELPHRLMPLEQLPGAVGNMLSPVRHNTNWIKAIAVFQPVNFGAPNGRG
jgi:2-epi-valiolone-7-phosphate 1-reductase